MNITREQLIDLLTTAAEVGLGDGSVQRAQTRGDITEIVERRMRKQIDALSADADGQGKDTAGVTRPDPEAMAELFARMSEMGESGRFIVLTTDPEMGPLSDRHAYGPYDGQEAATKADQLRRDFDRTDLANVKVEIIRWVEG